MRDYETIKALGMERLKTLTVESYECYAEAKNAQNRDLYFEDDMEETEYVKKATLSSLSPD